MSQNKSGYLSYQLMLSPLKKPLTFRKTALTSKLVLIFKTPSLPITLGCFLWVAVNFNK